MHKCWMLLSLLSPAMGATAVWAAPAASCDAQLLKSVSEAEHIVYSLKPDKPGQARVVASDLSEYTAGQALWLRSELRAVDRTCMRADVTDATQHLQAVQEMLRSHGSLHSTASRS